MSRRSRSSRSLRSVISLAILDAPTTLPSTSLIGEMVIETSTRCPSLRRQMVSNCSVRSPRRMRSRMKLALRRDKDGYRCADDLFRPVAEDPLGARVPAYGDPIEVRTCYRVTAVLDDGSEPPQVLFKGTDEPHERPPRSAKQRRRRKHGSSSSATPGCLQGSKSSVQG